MSLYIIAEISANHNGSLDRALKTILAAKHSGADAVKFNRILDTMTIKSDKKDLHIKRVVERSISFRSISEAYTPFEWFSII